MKDVTLKTNSEKTVAEIIKEQIVMLSDVNREIIYHDPEQVRKNAETILCLSEKLSQNWG